jgi:chromate transporter
VQRLAELARVFLGLGFSGFGGPLVHLAMMEEQVVTRRAWLPRDRFLEGWAVCQMLPGPASTQLGIYIGYLRAGFVGAIVTAICFILPGFLIILTYSVLYTHYGTLPATQGIFYGVKPAVIAIIAFSVYRLGASALTDRYLWALGIAAFLLTAIWRIDIVLLLVLAGCIGIVVYATPLGGQRLFSVPLLEVYAPLSFIFLKAGAFVYGGGYVIIPFVQQEVVERLHWMRVEVFLDGISLSQITPGPIVNVSAFVGYQVAGVSGAALAAFSVFLPAFIFIIGAAAAMERVRQSRKVQAFLKGINAGVVGAILGATVPLAQEAVMDLSTVLVATLVFGLQWRYTVPTPWLVLGAGVTGLGLAWLGA